MLIFVLLIVISYVIFGLVFNYIVLQLFVIINCVSYLNIIRILNVILFLSRIKYFSFNVLFCTFSIYVCFLFLQTTSPSVQAQLSEPKGPNKPHGLIDFQPAHQRDNTTFSLHGIDLIT